MRKDRHRAAIAYRQCPSDTRRWSLRPGFISDIQSHAEDTVGKVPLSVAMLAGWMLRHKDISSIMEAVDLLASEFGISRYNALGPIFRSDIPSELAVLPLQAAPMSAEEVLALLDPAARTETSSAHLDNPDGSAAPPPIPAQGVGPHFEIDERGVISFAPPETLDRAGNNVGRLRYLHPVLRDLVDYLVAALAPGNRPHTALYDRCLTYQRLVDQNLDGIDFGRLYVEGVRLANASRAAASRITADDPPPLDASVQEALDSLLALHGTFMMSTSEGIAAIADEERYKRRPDEEADYRAAAVDFARSLGNQPSIMDSEAANFILGAAEQIDRGSNLERSGVAGTGAVRNATITLAAGASIAAFPVVAASAFGAEGAVAAGVAGLVGYAAIKESKPFAATIAPITRGLNRLSEVEIAEVVQLLTKYRIFMLQIERKFRNLALYGESFGWLRTVLDRIKGQSCEC